jgi:uncharacterized phage-associated protein
MEKASSVAKYILKFCQDNNIRDCSNKKLQKLLYYVQAWSLVFRNKRMFTDKVEAWLHGPVISNVYHEFKEFGFQSITINLQDFNDNIFDDDDINLMNSVLRKYTEYDADYLEMRTHIEKPWKEARNSEDQIISCNSMKTYYEEVLKKNRQK